MSARILVPVDGSEESRRAFTHALAQFPKEHITLLHVIEPFPDHTKAGGHEGERIKQVFEKRQGLLDEIAERGDEYSGTITTDLVYGRPFHVIPRYVEMHRIDEVVIGSRGRDEAARLLLGSVAETVVHRVPVTVVRPTDEGGNDGYRPPERILVPFDRSLCSRTALEYVFEHFPDATVTALFVTYPSFKVYDPIESEDDLDVVLVDDEETRDEIHDIFEMARQIAERHERDGVARWLLGSVAETVVRRALVPVTAIK